MVAVDDEILRVFDIVAEFLNLGAFLGVELNHSLEVVPVHLSVFLLDLLEAILDEILFGVESIDVSHKKDLQEEYPEREDSPFVDRGQGIVC